MDCLYSFDCCTIYIVYIDLASWERQDLANQTVAFASVCDYMTKVISWRQEIEDKTYEYKEYRKKVLHKALCACRISVVIHMLLYCMYVHMYISLDRKSADFLPG